MRPSTFQQQLLAPSLQWGSLNSLCTHDAVGTRAGFVKLAVGYTLCCSCPRLPLATLVSGQLTVLGCMTVVFSALLLLLLRTKICQSKHRVSLTRHNLLHFAQDWESRTDDDIHLVERILGIVRNILHVPSDPSEEQVSCGCLSECEVNQRCSLGCLSG